MATRGWAVGKGSCCFKESQGWNPGDRNTEGWGSREARGSGKCASLNLASVRRCCELTQAKAGTGNWEAHGELVSGCRGSGAQKAGQEPHTEGGRAGQRPAVIRPGRC